MIRNTFVHIPGIGPKAEAHLWEMGFMNWDAFASHGQAGLSPNRWAFIQKGLDESKVHISRNDPNYFANRLNSRFHWRLFPEFRHVTAYLDIETTGMSASYDNITVIGLYDGESLFFYVKDRNLDAFREDIDKYKVIVTYNGKCFDIPFIREAMGLAMNHAHIDLRFVLASLGFSGGLKGCERQVGIHRGEVTGLDGYDAVLLWNLYWSTGNEKALETLLAYNLQDVVNLEALLVMAYNLKLKETPFADSHQLPMPTLPKIPFVGDFGIIEQIRMAQGRGFTRHS
jgi:uncharacterized protein YprB with RNaseH-like and TPR domain